MTSPLRAGAIGAAAVTGAVCLAVLPSHVSPSPTSVPSALLRILNALPHHALSTVAARVSAFPIPSPLRPHVYALYCPTAAEAALPLKQYSSFASFFARELKDGLRPVDLASSIVAPADATVVYAAKLGPGGRIPAKVKGTLFTLRDLIAAGDRDPIVAHADAELFAVVLRIQPRDCHRFYSPTEWTMENCRHIAGRLYWFTSNQSAFYTENERIAVTGNWRHGFFSLTAIGACGIGGVEVQDDVMEGSASVDRGHSLGGFRMGSAIVLVFEAPQEFEFTAQAGQSVRAGQALGLLQYTDADDGRGRNTAVTTPKRFSGSPSRDRVRRSW
jgi:phosphatidylserine decarboxylase